MTIAQRPASTASAKLRTGEPAAGGSDGANRRHLFIVGAGYVGLVTAAGMARLGHTVTVADIDPARIASLRDGRMPIFEPGLAEAIQEFGERLSFTTDLHPPSDVRYSFVTVGTPLMDDGRMSLDHVERAVGALLDATPPDHVIVVRSTLPPSGPDMLATVRAGHAGGAAIVTNPEFMREGSAMRDFERPDRIVTGWLAEGDREAAEEVIDLYAGIDAPTLVADARSVALVKIASNVFLALKVSYANELARLCDEFGADAAVVSDGLGLDSRIGRAFLDAGPGVGGSCLPEQAVALGAIARSAGVPAPLIAAVSSANAAHQHAIVGRLAALLDLDLQADPSALAGRRVALLGLSFKANTDDVRQSAALAIAADLRAAGASVVGTDPQAAERASSVDPELEIAPGPTDAAKGADAVLVVTEWPEYGALDWGSIGSAMRGDLVYDTRAIVDPVAVEAAGLRLERLGRPPFAQADA